jgi:hypothetical protein
MQVSALRMSCRFGDFYEGLGFCGLESEGRWWGIERRGDRKSYHDEGLSLRRGVVGSGGEPRGRRRHLRRKPAIFVFSSAGNGGKLFFFSFTGGRKDNLRGEWTNRSLATIFVNWGMITKPMG